MTLRVPEEVTTIDDLEEGEWTDDDEVVEDRAYKNIQELKISKIATGMILTANRHKHIWMGVRKRLPQMTSLSFGVSRSSRRRIRVESV